MLEGEISEIRLVERLVELWREQFTGAIRFESDAIIKIVYFKGGDILSASTNDRSDSIDEILMKAGKVTREHVKQALAKRKESETLGDALLNLGFITRKELTWARRVQVVGVIRSIAAWETGSFTIVADYLPKRDEGTLFPLPQVLVELIVTEQDRQQFERAMDGGNAVFEKTADFDDVFRRLGLNEDAEAIAAEIDGSQSASEVATSSGRDAFNVYKLLHALATLGVIRRGAKPQGQPQFSLDDFSSAGVADAADMWSEPEPAAQPMFQLDEAEALNQPTLEVPVGAMGLDAEPAPEIAWTPDPEPEPAATQGLGSAWDDDEQVEETPAVAPPPIAPPPATAAPMPAWDRPLVRTPVEPAPEVEKEPQWGFDEAQIETARRAAVPVASVAASGPGSPPPPERAPLSRPAAKSRKGSRLGLIVALLAIAILAAAGYYGWLWWQNREATSPAPVVATKRPAPRPRPTTPPATATIVETTTTATTDTATTATVAPATTTTVASTATTAPPPTATETAALPVVKPKTPLQVTPAPAPVASGSGRERLDAMAREYAANPSGNFTVQIQILCDPGNLGQAIATGGANVWFVPQTIGGRPCYRVFWGRYATRAEAQAGLGSVPAALRDRNAAVKPVPGR